MVEHVWSVLCESSLIDKDSGKTSLQTILDRIVIQEPNLDGLEGKGLYRPMHLVSAWCRSDLDQPETGWEAKVIVEAPDGSCIRWNTYDLDRLGDVLFYRVRVAYEGIPAFQGVGVYRFLVQLQAPADEEWRHVASVPVLVDHQPPAGAEGDDADGGPPGGDVDPPDSS